MNHDMIYRQDAIEAAIEAADDWDGGCSKERDRFIRDALEELPSVQSDIIRCKDCKHHWTHICIDSMPIERCDLEQTIYDVEHDFCSMAERKKK